MRCETVSMQLKTYLDGEARGLAALRIRCHVRHCSKCAAQLTQWQQMNTLLLSHDLFAAPALRSAAAPPMLKGRTLMSLKLLTGVTATVAAFALTALPDHGHRTMNMSMASEIRKAVLQVNTWHLKGWKMQGNSRIPWEVWGRRAPFFYREQVGPDVIVDDGKVRVSVFAPMPRNYPGTSDGFVVLAPSFPDARRTRWSHQRILDSWYPDATPESQTAEEATFNEYHRADFGESSPSENKDILTTVSKQTWLPTRFEARMGRVGGMRTISLLNADYDVPLPAKALTLPATPSDYVTYDATQPPPLVEDAATADGVTVQAVPLALAPDGKILLRVKTWLGSTLMRRKGPLHCDVALQNRYEPRRPAVQDDQERGYTEVFWDDVRYGATDTSSLMLLAPADPFAPNAPDPSELTLNLDVHGYLNTRLMESLCSPDDGYVLLHKITLKLTLPASSLPIEKVLPAYINAKWMQSATAYVGRENLTAAMDLARANFHGSNQDLHSASLPHLRQAVDYYEQYFLHTSLPSQINAYRYGTAQLCVRMGDKPRARRLLQAIAEANMPNPNNRPEAKPNRAQIPANIREQIEIMDRRNRERERKSALQALETWAR